MEVIRDITDLRKVVKGQVATVGFTRSTYFPNATHEHIYSHTVGRTPKMLGVVWDNSYDLRVWVGQTNIPNTVWDEGVVIDWFTNKNFDYLYLPEHNLISKMMSMPNYSVVRSQIETIWANEEYSNFVRCGFVGPTQSEIDYAVSFIKLVFFRHYLLATNASGSKFIDRIFQIFAPDGTFGYLYRDFMSKYIPGATYEMVDVLRKPDGLAFDIYISGYPVDVISLFGTMVPAFNQFRLDKNFSSLVSTLQTLLLDHPKFYLSEILLFTGPVFLNNYVLQIGLYNKSWAVGELIKYKIWEYADGV